MAAELRHQHILAEAVTSFLTDLVQANRSVHTYRAYATNLKQFAAWYSGPLNGITPAILRDYFLTLVHLRPTSRARQQAALASFLTWAYRQELIESNPIGRVERVKCAPPVPRDVGRKQVEAILAIIPTTQRRDRLLFRLIFETGLRVSEALVLYVEDVDLTPDDERLHILGKGNRQRTLLLDDPKLVKQLRVYLTQLGYKHGPLFRALKNGGGGPLRYQSIQERWAAYCAKASVVCTLHQLRHTHATELINGGVSLTTIRKRLGHKNLQTTLRYAEQFDTAADAEIRAWRRRNMSR